MPEGHTIHRLARDHQRWFAGCSLNVQSPQGRFTEGAALLDGATLERVDAWGKHLFYAFGEIGTLHIHLGLFGRFRARSATAKPPRSSPRLVLRSDEREVRLSGPTACELLDDERVRAIHARLGPDPLRPRSGARRFVERAAKSRRSAGSLLMEQSAIAGIGNVYRSELLFLERIHPLTACTSVSKASGTRVWKHATRLLELGVKLNRTAYACAACQGEPRP